MLNAYLRSGNPHKLSAREAQILFAFNREQFGREQEAFLERGITVVAEDYAGTGIAWGVARGASREFMEDLNSHFEKPDLAILLDGQPFEKGLESGHEHESDSELMKRSRAEHLKLAGDYGWHVVRANQSEEAVATEIESIVDAFLVLQPQWID